MRWSATVFRSRPRDDSPCPRGYHQSVLTLLSYRYFFLMEMSNLITDSAAATSDLIRSRLHIDGHLLSTQVSTHDEYQILQSS